MGEDQSSASKEQLTAYLRECGIKGARIEDEGGRTGTKWVVALGDQPQSKWDCFERKKQRDDVKATTWGQVKESA
jgi:hypothetical protein